MKSWIMVIIITCYVAAHSFADQTHLMDVNDSKTWRPSWKNDGDIHNFDIILRDKKFSEGASLLKVSCPQFGIWIREPQKKLPEGIDARYVHITGMTPAYYTKKRPLLDSKAKKGTPDATLLEADAMHGVANFDAALKTYVLFFNTYADHNAAPYAMFMAAQCLGGMHKFSESASLLKALISKYPKSSMVGPASFRIACLLAGHLNNKAGGIALFKSIASKYKKSAIAEAALLAIGALNKVDGNMAESRAAYSAYLRTFPNGRYVATARRNLL